MATHVAVLSHLEGYIVNMVSITFEFCCLLNYDSRLHNSRVTVRPITNNRRHCITSLWETVQYGWTPRGSGCNTRGADKPITLTRGHCISRANIKSPNHFIFWWEIIIPVNFMLLLVSWMCDFIKDDIKIGQK